MCNQEMCPGARGAADAAGRGQGCRNAARVAERIATRVVLLRKILRATACGRAGSGWGRRWSNRSVRTDFGREEAVQPAPLHRDRSGGGGSTPSPPPRSVRGERFNPLPSTAIGPGGAVRPAPLHRDRSGGGGSTPSPPPRSVRGERFDRLPCTGIGPGGSGASARIFATVGSVLADCLAAVEVDGHIPPLYSSAPAARPRDEGRGDPPRPDRDAHGETYGSADDSRKRPTRQISGRAHARPGRHGDRRRGTTSRARRALCCQIPGPRGAR
jgi:hypothetical protein